MKFNFGLICALLLGASIGAGGAWYACRHNQSKYLLNAAYSRVVSAVTTLSWMRRQAYQEVIANEERALTDYLFIISELLDGQSISDNEKRILAMAARYRVNNPFTTGREEMDKQTGDFLQHFVDKNAALHTNILLQPSLSK